MHVPNHHVVSLVSSLLRVVTKSFSIDILAAKSMVLQERHESSTRTRMRNETQRAAGLKYGRNSTVGVPGAYPMTNVETWVDVGDRSSSQEHIVEAGRLADDENPSDEFGRDAKHGGINKTVEFQFHTQKSSV